MPASPPFPLRLPTLALCTFLLGGCAVGPAYQRPATPDPAAFKEAQGWAPAAPADMLERGPWWTLFGDPVLDKLVASIEVSNQNVAAAAAGYAQARALVQEQRASLFPSLDLGVNADRSGGGNGTPSNRYRVTLGASWEPDLWGRLRASANGAEAGAQASAADLAAARLSAQGELVANYISLRETDALKELMAATISDYQRVMQITQNRFDAGIAAKSDVLQAQTQLATAQIDALSLSRQRAQLEHAIAVLLGKAPADFSLAAAPWQLVVPEMPAIVPSALLQRRPDIAAAERRVAQANEQIGVARAAYFPSMGLSGSYGSSASRVADLAKSSTNVWAFGASLMQSVFNAGATSAHVSETQAAHAAAVARYRQAVLKAFEDVEDQLTATHFLGEQQALRLQASQAANAAEAQMLNRYRAGQVSYTEVVTAQVTALSARRALLQSQADRQGTAVALIQALGGGWRAGQ